MRALAATLACLLIATASVARADAVPDIPEPRCDEGYVVTMTHSGPECARPSCRTDADCPSDLRCTPRRCMQRTYDEACARGEAEGSGAKGAPDPCEGFAIGGPCDEAHACPDPAFCPLGTCVPPDELPGSETSAPPPAGSGGGCCGSRGTHASLVAPLAMAVVVALRSRRRGRHSHG